jgi:hypothetical protein
MYGKYCTPAAKPAQNFWRSFFLVEARVALAANFASGLHTCDSVASHGHTYRMCQRVRTRCHPRIQFMIQTNENDSGRGHENVALGLYESRHKDVGNKVGGGFGKVLFLLRLESIVETVWKGSSSMELAGVSRGYFRRRNSGITTRDMQSMSVTTVRVGWSRTRRCIACPLWKSCTVLAALQRPDRALFTDNGLEQEGPSSVTPLTPHELNGCPERVSPVVGNSTWPLLHALSAGWRPHSVVELS